MGKVIVGYRVGVRPTAGYYGGEKINATVEHGQERGLYLAPTKGHAKLWASILQDERGYKKLNLYMLKVEIKDRTKVVKQRISGLPEIIIRGEYRIVEVKKVCELGKCDIEIACREVNKGKRGMMYNMALHPNRNKKRKLVKAEINYSTLDVEIETEHGCEKRIYQIKNIYKVNVDKIKMYDDITELIFKGAIRRWK